MSQSNEINFGPVFMRGRKPAPVSNKTTPITQNQFSQPQRPNSSGTTPNTVPKTTNQAPSLGSFSPANNTTSLPLPKSFSAAVSPAKEIDHRAHPNGLPTQANHHTQATESTPQLNGHNQSSEPADYSRETLLNLYSENLASKLPPDLEITDPAVTVEFVGPPLAFIEMTETEKELFAGPFNSEKRSAVNKVQQHHSNPDHHLGLPGSPETTVNHGLGNNKLSVGGPVKLAKQNPIERFNSLGIQGGVLAGVASPSHANARRRGDNELDSNESPRRFQRTEDSSPHAPPWSATPRDRRTRDLAPPSDGKWKRGVSFEEKIQASQDSPGGTNLKYSVLDKMRERAAGNLEASSKEASHETYQSTPPTGDQPSGDPQLSLHTGNQPPRQFSEDYAAGRSFDDNQPSPSPVKADSGSNHQLSTSGPTPSPDARSSGTQPAPSSDQNPENIAWQYRDPSGTVQGPFTAFQMQEWYKATFFRDDLLVKRVIDGAFETLETLILRVGDRDRPFLSRPPPALPPNLPLPEAHSHNHQLPTSQPSPRPLSSFLDQASSLPPQTENSSAVDSTLLSNSARAPSQHVPISAPDPWNGMAPGASPLLHPGNIPASTPLASGPGWNSSLPAFAAHPNLRANDYVINDGLVEFNNLNLLNNGIIPNLPNGSYVSQDTFRFLQHAQHPAMSMATANGYPFPLPLPQPPNFGQMPSMPHLGSNSAMDPLLVAQLHTHLFHSLLNNRAPTGGEGIEPQTERPSHENPMPHLQHVDPWQVSPPPPNDCSVETSDRIPLQPMAMASNPNQSAFPAKPDEAKIHESPSTLQKSDNIRPSGQYTPAPTSSELKLSVPDQTHTKSSKSQPVSAVNSEKEVKTFPATEGQTAPVTSSSNTVSHVSVEKEPVGPATIPTQAQVPTESTRDSLTPQSPSTALPEGESTSDPANSNQSWRNVNHQTAAKPPSVPRTTGSIVPPAAKSSGKVVVLSKAQQDEQDRRTASIQKAQLQLKEAQAVERAAREASEAAAAATASSFNTPAPWLKEEKVSTNLSLTEIQAIEAKQLEKRRLAEKQAAANRAMAEQAMAAERAMKAAKESLPATSNWAATATSSSPTKQSVTGTVWGSKETETPAAINGPKQSMKQIQEEEARKKSLALQQQQQSRPAAGAIKTVGGYAGTVASASNKPAVSGPWAVVGPKSKVIAPPAAAPGRPAVVGAAPTVVGSGVARVGGSVGTTLSKPAPKPISVSKPVTTTTATKSNLSGPPSATNGTPGVANSAPNPDSPPPASPEFMKWLREALRGMNNVDDFVKMLLDFPVNPDESVLEIVSDSVYAGSATLDGRRFAKEFNARRIADVASRSNTSTSSGVGGNKGGGMMKMAGNSNGLSGSNHPSLLGHHHSIKKSAGYLAHSIPNHPSSSSSPGSMADALKLQPPPPKNDGWGFAVVGAKKKKK
ncbi:uncharacterized protein PGTG_05977 [Puccinia graminis f. sp. tritici CRL 75-36-700-3]|uniref:GYF domain-containing protein n=1 Tax=Puccinia graminis f. sp. tritici (strain CRL 75-36-700-3 / race SCCL) TaxID=418459 RepID=E3K685_PUCGT|nr:uncharacterized protein PGTG_05977 [Puccinia graminis f. sp. tritici CRL 75-36-700-3]EFP79656.1 hypothetical protein PGTG_05977 [Puccinia graminis f. sp. tritici CRL 75-36-700-3]